MVLGLRSWALEKPKTEDQKPKTRFSIKPCHRRVHTIDNDGPHGVGGFV